MLALLLLAASISANFEGGSLDQVEVLSPTHLRCGVKGEVDQDQRNRQASWFYFRLDSAAGRQVSIDLVNLPGEYDYRPGNLDINEHTRPVYSYDRKNWKHFADDEVEWNDREVSLRLRLRPVRNRVWIARCVPYLESDFNRLMREMRGNPYLRRDVIGKSVQGRDLLLLTVASSRAPEASRKVIWLMARQHAWEAGTSWVIDGALRYLLSSDPQAIRLRSAYVFKMLPMCDPDGVVRGGVRYNLHGYDLNRNWDAFDARLRPEIFAEHQAILGWLDAGNRIDFFLNLHNTNEDYVEGPLSEGGPTLRQLGERFARLLSDRTSFYSASGPRDSLPPGVLFTKGRISADPSLFRERKLPAFLLELGVQYNPSLKRLRTVEDWRDFGRALVQVLGKLQEITDD
jgi:murein tripeptide amidase MpaA